MNIVAIVQRINGQTLLVRDTSNGQEILVHFAAAGNFRPGDVVQITFSGAMTPSIPPQISATQIVRVQQPAPGPTVIRRATILQIGTGMLLVRDPSTGQQVLVRYPYAHHFCVGQRVDIPYDTTTFGTPREVTATDIRPLC